MAPVFGMSKEAARRGQNLPSVEIPVNKIASAVSDDDYAPPAGENSSGSSINSTTSPPIRRSSSSNSSNGIPL
jgi:hypothetical protein